MKEVIKLLKQLDDDNIKTHFKQGRYELEGCVIELLDRLEMSGCDAERNTQRDAIVTYLYA